MASNYTQNINNNFAAIKEEIELIKSNYTPIQTTNAINQTIGSIPANTSDLVNDSGYITGINSSDVTTALGYTPANTTLSNLGATSSTNFDGSPTFKFVQLIESKVKVNTSTNLKSTGYLPNDNYRYEVFVGNALRASTSIAAAISNVASPLTNSNSGFTCKTRVSTDSRYSYNNCWIPLDTNGIIYYETDGAPGTGITFEIFGYRRIGTNT